MLHDFTPGAYQFLQGGFPYSAGVIAQPGWAIQRVRFARPVPVAAGFAAIERHLAAIGRPLTALCAAELRSPSPFSMGGFQDFNRGYVDVLARWGLVRDGLNPVARSNVCPAFDAPAEPSFHAFSFTVPDAAADPGRDFLCREQVQKRASSHTAGRNRKQRRCPVANRGRQLRVCSSSRCPNRSQASARRCDPGGLRATVHDPQARRTCRKAQ